MKISRIAELLHAEVVSGMDLLDNDVHSACGSDMMSDVLAFVKDQAVLLTGLVNPQVIRTAEMMDMRCVVFVRGKKPTFDVIDLAELYIRIIFIGMPVQMLYNFCAAVLRAVGDTKRPLYFLTLAGVINVFLTSM